MRELEEKELEQVTGGASRIIGIGVLPGTRYLFPDVTLGGFVEKQMSSINIRQNVNPAELTS